MTSFADCGIRQIGGACSETAKTEDGNILCHRFLSQLFQKFEDVIRLKVYSGDHKIVLPFLKL